MGKLLGENTVHPKAPAQMKKASSEGTRWAAYQNHAMDSSGLGELRFLAVGPNNTIKEKPARYPDTHLGTGWAYLFVGWVNLETGQVEEAE
jgi:hypothetical protein